MTGDATWLPSGVVTLTTDFGLSDPYVGVMKGVLLAQGSAFGGYVLFMRDGRLHYVHNFCALEEFRVTSNVDVPAGRRTLTFRFEKTGEHRGHGTLLLDGAPHLLLADTVWAMLSSATTSEVAAHLEWSALATGGVTHDEEVGVVR